MEVFFKCAVAAILTAITAAMLKNRNGEFSLVLVIVAGTVLIGSISWVFSRVILFLDELSQLAGIAPEVLSPLLKVMAVSIITKISCDICKDAGAGSLASVIELCGCVIAVMLSIPLITIVMELVTSFG